MCSLLALCSCRFVSFPIICIFFRFHYFIILFSCLSVLYLSCCFFSISFFFFFNDTAPPEIYPLSLHDALPISPEASHRVSGSQDVLEPQRNLDQQLVAGVVPEAVVDRLEPVEVHEQHRHRRRSPARSRERQVRSEEHTSELQSRSDLVCRLLLE